jgi:hypothetical protein
MFDRDKGVKLVQKFLDSKIAERARQSLGRLNQAGRMVSRADICALAALMYLLRVDPEDPRYYETTLPDDYLNIFRKCLPHQRTSLQYIMALHRASLIDAYRAIANWSNDQRTAAFSTLMSTADLETFMRFRERTDI